MNIQDEVQVVSELSTALPREFDFYHLGQVSIHEEIIPTDFSEMKAVGFSFQGDLRGLMVLLFDEGLDASAYTEMGNVLAARIATQLSKERGLEIMISPPSAMPRERLEQLIDAGHVIIQRTYMHRHSGLAIPIQALLLPATQQEAGNA
jgi:hypothetical protein